jgi:hypothetical protein
MNSSSNDAGRRGPEGDDRVERSWKLFLMTLPWGARALAWLMRLVHRDAFADEVRVFDRLVIDPCPEELDWIRGYLAHPRYRRASLARRLGLRGRVTLLNAWAREYVRPASSPSPSD